MVRTERLADLGDQLGLSLPMHRPRLQSASPSQALGLAFQPRRLLGVTFSEFQLA
jgi:hypothetical protein